MANMFALILTVLTFITGIIWCLDKIKWAPARRAKQAKAAAHLEAGIDDKTLAEGAKPSSVVETAVSVFPVLAIVLIVRSCVFEPFQIPSGSMMPTLLIGDFIVVEKFAYGIKDPITQTTLLETGHPERGDIAVFKYPLQPGLDYIKRVVGLPGDRISYDAFHKTLTINPDCGQGNACQVPVVYTDVQPAEFVQTFPGSADNENSSGFYQLPADKSLPGGFRLTTRRETLADVTHDILMVPQAGNQVSMYYQQPGQPVATWVVPAGHYFMMGDNRDNSADSRFWGFVPEKNLVGKAVAIWMSFEKQEGQWPTGVRLNRIGGIH